MRFVRLACFSLALFGVAAARADGAFPDSMQIMAPPDKPHQLVLGTNFGLLISEDDGASWSYLCEEAIGGCAHLYQMSAPPSDSITAITATGVVMISNNACTQQLAQASFNGVSAFLTDAFPDPVDANHVFAIGFTSMTSGTSALYESRDRGASFPTRLYEAPAGLVLTGVENARTDGRTVYLTGVGGGSGPSVPTILRSTDGGNSFTAFDQTATLGAGTPTLAAVDRADASRLYLRVSDAAGTNSLAISTDGGATSTIRLSLPAPYKMTAFLQLADGTLLVTGLLPGPRVSACGPPDFTGADPGVAYLSTDGGQHFGPWDKAPHVRALTERSGVLYVVANNFVDGFALASTTDKGEHFTPLLQFDQIAGPLACATGTCAAPWAEVQSLFGIPDGGVTRMPPGPGCGCALGAVEDGPPPFVVALALIAMVFLGLRTRRWTTTRNDRDA